MGDDALDRAVRALGTMLVTDARTTDALERVAALADDALPGRAVALSVVGDGGRPVATVVRGDVAPVVERRQYDDGGGPSVAAYEERRAVVVDDTRQVALRWPAFAEVAPRHGVLSALALPLGDRGVVVGTLGLYAPAPAAFGPCDAARVGAFARRAGVVLANHRAYWDSVDLATRLDRAMESRAVIEQAKGALMASTGCDADEAFEILAKASQRENVKLRDVARRIVASDHPRGGATAR